MLYFYDDTSATDSIRISNSEIAELDLVAKIKESDLDKYLKKYLKKDTNVWFYYDLSDLAEDYDCQYVQNDEFGLWYTDISESKESLKESKNKYKFYDEYSDVFTAISKDNGKTFTIIDDDTFTDVADKDYGLKPNQTIDIDYVNEVSLAYELLEKKSMKESKNITLSDLCDTLGISYMNISSIRYDDNEGTSYNCDEMLRVGIKIINNVAIQITGFGNFIGAFNFNKYKVYSEPSSFILEDNKLRFLEIYLK